MGSSADGKFRRCGFLHIVSSGVKLQGFNPGSLLRSKSKDTKDAAKQRLRGL